MTDSTEAPTYRRSLSPSRAGDFQNCPLLYRFRTIDRLPEPPSPAMVRGTLVHAVLEDLFAEPAPVRTLERAVDLLPSEWEQLRQSDPRTAELFSAEQAADETAWLASAIDLLTTYFTMEDPRYLEPAAREERVSYEPEPGLSFGGIVDRIDIAPDAAELLLFSTIRMIRALSVESASWPARAENRKKGRMNSPPAMALNVASLVGSL